MKTLFNYKIKVIKNQHGKLEFQGDTAWIDFVQEILEDVNDFPNSGSNIVFKQTHNLVKKYFIGEDVQSAVFNYFVRNGCSNDFDVYSKMKNFEFVKGFCGILGNLILYPQAYPQI